MIANAYSMTVICNLIAQRWAYQEALENGVLFSLQFIWSIFPIFQLCTHLLYDSHHQSTKQNLNLKRTKIPIAVKWGGFSCFDDTYISHFKNKQFTCNIYEWIYIYFTKDICRTHLDRNVVTVQWGKKIDKERCLCHVLLSFNGNVKARAILRRDNWRSLFIYNLIDLKEGGGNFLVCRLGRNIRLPKTFRTRHFLGHDTQKLKCYPVLTYTWP